MIKINIEIDKTTSIVVNPETPANIADGIIKALTKALTDVEVHFTDENDKGMKTTELRMGNFVDIPKNWIEPIEEVYAIDEYGINGIVNPNDSNDISYPEWKPIPINEEWLLKLGFHKEDMTRFTKVPIGFGIVEDVIFISFDWNEHDDGTQMPVSSVKYVHQLQNLYFALTGKELTQNK